MAILMIILDPKMFYQFCISLEFSIFGKYIMDLCDDDSDDSSHDTSTDTSDSTNRRNLLSSDESECDASIEYYAYYYVALVLFLTLGM